jgi:hypothetical protein
MTERLGDAPIEEKYRAQMNALARTLDEVFNGEDANPHLLHKEDKRKVGFVLLVFPYNDHEGRCNYISNGADRRDIVALFKEQIKRFEGQPDLKGTA